MSLLLARQGGAPPLITGTVDYTNNNDTVVATGGHGPSGTSSTTNANDSVAASGGHGPSGTSSTTNANDTVTAVGGHGPSGTVAYTNADDTVVATGTFGADTPPTGGHSGIFSFPIPFRPPAEPPPMIFGYADVTNNNDTVVASGMFDPYNLLIDDEELLLLA